jgi:putative metalloprotease
MCIAKIILTTVTSVIILSGCANGSFNTNAALSVGAGAVQALTLDENSVKQTATLAAKEYDGKHQVAAANDPNSQRLFKLTNSLQGYEGLQLNFKVYKADDINAFAMADGTVRVYTGLMGAMPDDQVLAVIGHEIGHVKLKHSYHQMRTQLISNTAMQAVVGMGGVVGALSKGQLGQLASGVVSAQFSQRDELAADKFAIKLLKDLGKDPQSMTRSIKTLKAKFGTGGGFMSSHPSNDERISNLEAAIAEAR